MTRNFQLKEYKANVMHDIDHTDPQNDLSAVGCITKLPLHRGWN
jgi:hypothetical protein